MKLYKYKSAENTEKIDHILEIIQSKKFFFSEWKELNDPMEGYFYCSSDDRFRIMAEKENLRMCCFSEKNDDILLWTHYAAGHKGVCVEVDTVESADLRKVDYVKSIPTVRPEEDFQMTGRDVLACKINKWRYEAEYRLFADCEKKTVGRITSIIFGVRTTEALRNQIIKTTTVNPIRLYAAELDFKNNKIKGRPMRVNPLEI